jgi:hypothetical protein
MGANIRALIVEEFVVDREDPAILVDRGAHMVMLLARMIGGHQMLAPVLDPFDRAAEPERGERNEHIFGIEFPADAETAADMPLVEMHRGRATPECAGEQVAGSVRHLGGAVKLENIGRAIVSCERTARLQRDARMAPDREIELYDCVSRAEAGRDVAIAFADDLRFGADRVLRGHHRWQIFDLDDDQFGGVLRQIRVFREHRRDRLPDIAHQVGRQHRLQIRSKVWDLTLAQPYRREIGDLSGSPDGNGTRGHERRGSLDRADRPVCVARAHYAHVNLMRESQVRNEAPLPGEERRIFEP